MFLERLERCLAVARGKRHVDILIGFGEGHRDRSIGRNCHDGAKAGEDGEEGEEFRATNHGSSFPKKHSVARSTRRQGRPRRCDLLDGQRWLPTVASASSCTSSCTIHLLKKARCAAGLSTVTLSVQARSNPSSCRKDLQTPPLCRMPRPLAAAPT